MLYTIQIEADDLTDTINKLSTCSDIKIIRFGPAETPVKRARPVVGAKPHIKTPADMKGQIAFLYSLFEDGKTYRPYDLTDRFGEQYPHLRNPYGSIAPLLSSLHARGFIQKSDDGYYRNDK